MRQSIRRSLPLRRFSLERVLSRVAGSITPVLLVSFLAFVSVPAEASTPTISLGTTSFPASTATNPDITLSGFDSSKTYQVTVKFVNSSTNVDVTNGTLTVGTTAGLSLISGYSSYTAQTKLGFKGPFSSIQTALASITWTPSSTGADISMRIGIAEDPGANSFYDANSGHYYEYVSSALNWTAARTDAESRTKFGMKGYLAMITSQAENDFIKSETTATNVWFGASDRAVEGTWVWDGATGADAPTVTSSSAGVTATVKADASVTFHSWATGEPNDAGGNEDCPVTNWGGSAGMWNDLSCTSTNGYLVEYGSRIGQSSTAISATRTQVVTIVVAGAPGAPTITSITPSNQTLSINFTAGSGSGVTSYQYSLDGGAWTNRASGTTASPLQITGLTNGTTYSVRIRAVNASGNGTASTAVSGTPSDVPSAPTSVTAIGGEGQASVSWSAPVSNGGSAITSYTVTASPGGSTCTTASTSCTITGLGAGSYTFTVVATNSAGNSSPSSASPSVSVNQSASSTTQVPSPKIPLINEFARGVMLIKPGQNAIITGHRLNCTTQMSINGIPTNFKALSPVDGQTRMSIEIPSSLQHGRHSLTMDSCGGEITYTNMFMVAKPEIQFESVTRNAMDRGLQLVALRSFVNQNRLSYNSVHCIVNVSSPQLQESAKQMLRTYCDSAYSRLASPHSITLEQRVSHKPNNIWVRVILSNK